MVPWRIWGLLAVCTGGLSHTQPGSCADPVWPFEAKDAVTPDRLTPIPARNSRQRCERVDPVVGHVQPLVEALWEVVDKDAKRANQVFVVANGENYGLWFHVDPNECLGSLADAAASKLRPSAATRRERFLYTMAGLPVRDGSDVEASGGLLALLLEGEAWVWNGVEPGFTFQVLPGVTIRTLSLSPKALQVSNVLENSSVDELIASGRRSMQRSPEKHYTKGFDNYRTSKSAFLTGSHPVHGRAREMSQFIARLPSRRHAEWPQLLRYDPGDWYKSHLDTFHNYIHPNASRAATHQSHFGHWVEWIKNQLVTRGGAVAERAAALGLSPVSGNMDAFELALIGQVLAHDSTALPSEWVQWLRFNHQRNSSGLVSALVDPSKGLAGALPVVQRRWAAAVGAAQSMTVGYSTSVDAAREELLGPPWVEPNRHCTLMFYLNQPESGGAETAFPLADTHALALPDGTMVPGDGGVAHAGIPECSHGLRVAPFTGGGALFYHKHGNGTNDDRSMHAGCPPHTGDVAWKVNGFMWNVDNDAGLTYFRG